MILDGICYLVIHFSRAILYVWSSPPAVSLFLSFLGEYLAIFTSTFFVLRRLLTSSVSLLMLFY